MARSHGFCGTSQKTALGALDLARPAELQAFGFRTEAAFPAGSVFGLDEKAPSDLEIEVMAAAG